MKRRRNRPTDYRRTAWRKQYVDYIHSPEWKMFRLRVFALRGRKCERCGSTHGEMHVHHSHYERFGREEPEDVMVLCEDCHSKTHARKAAKPGRDIARWFASLPPGDPTFRMRRRIA